MHLIYREGTNSYNIYHNGARNGTWSDSIANAIKRRLSPEPQHGRFEGTLEEALLYGGNTILWQGPISLPFNEEDFMNEHPELFI